jgi:biuret amidohydrolase
MTYALVLLDMQKGILQSDRIPWEDKATPEHAIAAASSVLDAARRAGTLVVHVGVVRPHARGAFDVVRSANARKSGRVPRDILALAAASPDVEFVLPPIAGEETVNKIGVSAFHDTRLDSLLRHARVDDVMVAGAFTHMVVESTVRHGFDLGYRMTVIEDACCAPAAAPHQAAINITLPNFAVIVSSAEAVKRLESGVSHV